MNSYIRPSWRQRYSNVFTLATLPICNRSAIHLTVTAVSNCRQPAALSFAIRYSPQKPVRPQPRQRHAGRCKYSCQRLQSFFHSDRSCASHLARAGFSHTY